MDIHRIEKPKKSEAAKSREKAKAAEPGASFLGVLGQAEVKEKHRELDSLLKEAEEQGKRLLHNISMEEMKKYRQAIGSFLAAALGESYRLTESHAITRDGRYSAHVKLEKIENGLEEMTKMVMAGQAEPLKLLAKVDEIKGMLMDIYK